MVNLTLLIFMGNAQLQAKRWKGVSPPPLWLPDAITPEQVLRHHRPAQGRQGGHDCRPFVFPVLFISFLLKESLLR